MDAYSRFMNQKLTDLFLAELEREAKGTRRALERVPDGRADWKPHAKSMSLGRLSTLVAGMPSWIDMMINMDQLDIGAGGGDARPPESKTSRELLDAHEAAMKKARESLSQTTEEHLMAPWKLLVAGKVVAEQPRHIMIRDTINHLAHHRGQLTVFLRLLDAPVPAIYGPSADDARFD
jgi:uncharacterized damage-inducible protein DinB